MLNSAPSSKATNINLSSDVSTEAEHLSINISQISDQFLSEPVRGQRKQQWQHDNAEFIAVYNQIVEQEELPLQQWRTF